MNLAILLVGAVLGIIAGRSATPPLIRRLATVGLILMMLVAPFATSTTSILFDALTAMAPDAQLLIATHADAPWNQAFSFERFFLAPAGDPRAGAGAGEE